MSISASPLTVKICGLSTPETLEVALDAGADMVGLVFHPKSPRNVSMGQATALANQARGRAEIVALIVDFDAAMATELAQALKLDWLQLHGSETPDQVSATRAASGVRVIKAIGVSEAADLAAVSPYRDVADMILLDAKPPKEAAYPGGHGKPFDWNILAALAKDLSFMLSGGLTPLNVADAIRAAKGHGLALKGVDVSSGVESVPGVKDAQKIRDFIAAARSAS
ncbi:MAG: phosphoribosylanthranilate isomerase [Bosea sp. (in: a-proteobacteria)]